MLVTELYTHQIPELYHRFTFEIGDRHWRERVILCKQEIKGNELLRDYLQRENSIAFQLNYLQDLITKYGGIPAQALNDRNVYPAVSFAAQVLSVIDRSSTDDANRFRRRVHGAFKNPDDMRGLLLELTAATHFIKRGYQISWPEVTGAGTFDLLIEGLGRNGLEIECKSISEDKGRKIHEREVREFYALLKPNLRSYMSDLATGISVVLTLPGRISPKYKDRQALAKCVGSAISTSRSCTFSDGSNISITDFDVRELGHVAAMDRPRDLRNTVDGITGTENRPIIVIGTEMGGALTLAIQSAQDDNPLKAIFDTLSDAARRQLTHTRPGMLFTSFHGLDADQLVSVAEQDRDNAHSPSALRVAVSRFLSSPHRDHVVGVGFISRSSLYPAQDGIVDSRGAAYYFPKRESPLWSEDFSGIFNWSDAQK